MQLIPPNTVLVVDEIEGKQDIVIVELFNPVYDYDKKTLKYEVTPNNATSIELLSEFGQITIIIDTKGTSSFEGQFIGIDNFGGINVHQR